MKDWLGRIRALPLQRKKQIIWLAIGILGIGLLVWWIRSVPGRLQGVEWSGREERPLFEEESWGEIDQLWSGWGLEETFRELEELNQEIIQEDEQSGQ